MAEKKFRREPRRILRMEELAYLAQQSKKMRNRSVPRDCRGGSVARLAA